MYGWRTVGRVEMRQRHTSAMMPIFSYPPNAAWVNLRAISQVCPSFGSQTTMSRPAFSSAMASASERIASPFSTAPSGPDCRVAWCISTELALFESQMFRPRGSTRQLVEWIIAVAERPRCARHPARPCGIMTPIHPMILAIGQRSRRNTMQRYITVRDCAARRRGLT